MVTAPSLEPAGSANEYTLQGLERLQEAATFMRAATGKQMQRKKRYYDASVPDLQHVGLTTIIIYAGQFASAEQS